VSACRLTCGGKRSLDWSLHAPHRDGNDHAPALILWGARDQLLTREDQQALAAAILASWLIIYQDTRHLVLWEQPERVASDLAAFIGSLREQPA
jgi:pimeloyl-ACP methyl ester carboxylesterase